MARLSSMTTAGDDFVADSITIRIDVDLNIGAEKACITAVPLKGKR